MTKITESAIELLAIQRLESLGYQYLDRKKVKAKYGDDIDKVFFLEDDTFPTRIW